MKNVESAISIGLKTGISKKSSHEQINIENIQSRPKTSFNETSIKNLINSQQRVSTGKMKKLKILGSSSINSRNSNKSDNLAEDLNVNPKSQMTNLN